VNRYVDITDPRVVKAMAHPLRVRILETLDGRVASPSEMADELGVPVQNVSYHVHQLASLGLIKLVKKTHVRGAIEHHYRAEERPHITDAGWANVPGFVQEAMVGAWLEQVSGEVNAAAAAGGFGRSDIHISRTELELDERGWADVARELARALERIDKIQGATSKRLAKTEHAERLRTTAVLMHFERAEVPASRKAGPHKSRGKRRALAGKSG
jgi:DNA-binding transcriptional ArsR family regulator